MEVIGNQSYENEIIRGDEVHRINTSKMAEEALVGVLERVNNGFEGGSTNSKLTKHIINDDIETLEK